MCNILTDIIGINVTGKGRGRRHPPADGAQILGRLQLHATTSLPRGWEAAARARAKEKTLYRVSRVIIPASRIVL